MIALVSFKLLQAFTGNHKSHHGPRSPDDGCVTPKVGAGRHDERDGVRPESKRRGTAYSFITAAFSSIHLSSVCVFVWTLMTGADACISHFQINLYSCAASTPCLQCRVSVLLSLCRLRRLSNNAQPVGGLRAAREPLLSTACMAALLVVLPCLLTSESDRALGLSQEDCVGTGVPLCSNQSVYAYPFAESFGAVKASGLWVLCHTYYSVPRPFLLRA